MISSSLKQRIIITKKNQILRRKPGISHNKANKRPLEKKRRQKLYGLNIKRKNIWRYLNS